MTQKGSNLSFQAFPTTVHKLERANVVMMIEALQVPNDLQKPLQSLFTVIQEASDGIAS
jgi:hypothetical protein